MQDSDCVRFLQWALPQLRMRWAGFRKVRKQVCKRLARRLSELDISDVSTYQLHLAQHPHEWQHLDTLCRVVITRFYRDKQVFTELTENVLPQLASRAVAEGRTGIRAWSAGSASGEEPYTLAILWQDLLSQHFPHIQLSILGTEINPDLIERSHSACYDPGTIKNLPGELRMAAFTNDNGHYCLKSCYKRMVDYRLQDIRTSVPDELFDLILCRNLVFTYFDEPQQRTILQRLMKKLIPGGWLVLGVHETLPAGTNGLEKASERLGLYRRMIDN